MTNRIAIAIGLIMAAFLVVDSFVFGWANTLFLAKKFADLIEWMAFWR